MGFSLGKIAGPVLKVGGQIFGGTVGKVASAVGDYLGKRQANRDQARIAQEATVSSAAQAQGQMDFQERMSSTAYQRAMADMRAGGLNPILAYSHGGASTPGGAMGVVSVPHYEDPYGGGVTAMSQAQHVRQQESDTRKSQSQADILQPLAELARQIAPMIGAGVEAIINFVKHLAERYARTEAEVPKIVAEITHDLEQAADKGVGVLKEFWDKLHRPPPAPRSSAKGYTNDVSPAFGRRHSGSMRGKLGSARSDFYGSEER